MRATTRSVMTTLLFTELLSSSFAQPAQPPPGQPAPAQIAPAQPAPGQPASRRGGPCAQIAAACKQGGFVSNGAKTCWHRGGLHPTDYGGHATRSAGHQAFAANRAAGCSGVQAAESELRNGPGEITTKRTTNNQTSGHVESHLGKARQCALVSGGV